MLTPQTSATAGHTDVPPVGAAGGAVGTSSRRVDALLGAIVAGSVLALYVRTLLPHLGGSEDTAKFQYLGSVLGTAHSPGYPLYIILSYLFSHLPFGTLAYRINLMSACFAAAAVGLCYLIVRELGCRRIVAAAIAVAMAGGHVFWENSVIAEVYTLNAALWAAAVLMLVRWNASGRERDLYGATLFVALGLGNHLTILGLLPAAFACLLLSGRRWFRGRIVLTCAAILAAGLAQYGFIWLRTVQNGPYLESRASNVRELIEVMTARRYANLMFHLDAHTLVTERLPLLWSACRAELGYIGLAAAGLGLVLLRKRPAQGALIALGALSVLALTANVVADIGGFLLPVFVMLWLAAGVGFEGVLRTMRNRLGVGAGIAALLLVAGMPIGQLRANYDFNDHHDDRTETRYFDALFRGLPPRAALITEDYSAEQMVQYGIVSKDFNREGPPPQLLPADPDSVRRSLASGIGVFVLPRGVDPLRGYGFEFAPFPLWGPTVREYFGDIADGQIVVVGASGVNLPDALVRAVDGLAVRGSSGRPVFAIVAVKGSKGFTFQYVDTASVHLSVSASQAIGSARVHLPVDVNVAATPAAATITIDGQEIASAKNGLALAVLDPNGRIRDLRSFEAEHGFRAELRPGPRPLVQVTTINKCLAIGDNAWHDVTEVSPGGRIEARIDDYRPFDASVVFYVASDVPLRPELADFYGGCQGAEPCPAINRPRFTWGAYPLDTPDARAAWTSRSQADGLTGSPTLSLSQAQQRYRIEVVANDEGQYAAFWLRLNGLPAHVFARAETDVRDPARASVCAQSGTAAQKTDTADGVGR